MPEDDKKPVADAKTLEELAKLPPKERIRRLRELEEQRKKEIEQIEVALKASVRQATEQDTLYDTVFDGLEGRVLKTREAIAMTRRGFPVVEAVKGALLVKELMGLSWPKFAAISLEMLRVEEGHPLWVLARQAVGNMKHLKALNEDDVEGGILFAGQCCGGIDDNPTTGELIGRIMAEAEAALEKMNSMKA